MRVEFVNPFLTSLLNVLTTMAAMEAVPARPQLKKDTVARGEVTGLIAMSGEQTSGSLAISFEKAVICNIAKRLLNEEISDIDDTITDLVGEITNMVTGGAKKMLGERGYSFDMTRPSVMAGAKHAIRHRVKGNNIIIAFTTEMGSIFVEVCF